MTLSAPQKDSSSKHLRGKKLLLYVTIMVCILTATAVSIIQMNNIVIGGSGYQAIKNSTDAIENVALINSNLHQIINEVRPIMHDADKGAAITMARLLTIEIDRRFVNLQELVKSPGRREAVIKADAGWKEYKKTLLEEIIPAAGKGDKLKIAYLTTGIQAQRYNSLNKTMTALTSSLRQDITEKEQQAASDKTIKIAAMALLTSGALGLIVYFSLILSKSFTKSLQPAINHAREVSDGRLDGLLLADGRGKSAELQDAINMMTNRFRQTVSSTSVICDGLSGISSNLSKASSETINYATDLDKTLHTLSKPTETIVKSSENITAALEAISSCAAKNASAAAQVASNCQEIAPQTEQLENRAQQISSAASELNSASVQISSTLSDLQRASVSTSASILQLNAAIRQVETSALNTSAITEALQQDAETGRLAAEEAIIGIKAIRSSSRLTSEAVESLSLRANDIDSIISVIDEVAEQANLLALNATIIASQAGEHGKGFAVVAEEIRELSDRTSSSTREISAVIRGIQQETRKAAGTIAEVEANIINGEQLSQRAGMALNQVVCSIQQACIQVREIADVTSGQAQKSLNFKESIDILSMLAEQSAKMSEEQSETSNAITAFSGDIIEMAADLRSFSFKQSSTSDMITTLSTEISSLTEGIREAVEVLKAGSRTIAESTGNLDTAGPAVVSAATLENSINELNRQIELQKSELSTYKL